MLSILLIDEQQVERERLSEYLTTHSCVVTAVQSIEEATALIVKRQQFAGFICDVAKKYGTGVDFACWLYEHFYDHPPLLLHSLCIWDHTFDLRSLNFTQNQQIRFHQKANLFGGQIERNYRYIDDFVADLHTHRSQPAAA